MRTTVLATDENPGPRGNALDLDEHLFLTVDDDNEDLVLELVRSNVEGMFIRDRGQWMKINPDEDNERIWDRVIIDVRQTAIDAFDDIESTSGEVTVNQLRDHVISEGDAA